MIKIYEPKKESCKICELNDSLYLPICIIDGVEKMYPVCKDCLDKVPYKTIPVTTVMDTGYIFCPELGLNETPHC